MNEVILKVSNIEKRFGATQALKGIDLEVQKGMILGLVGRNGAGKSTLVNIIAGIYSQDGGTVEYEGMEISHLSVLARQELGIFMVTQNASIIPDLSVAENIFMGLWPMKKSGVIDWAAIHREAKKALALYDLDVDPKEKIYRLSAVDQRKVNIVRSLFGGAKMILLDEPTTSLSAEERDCLYSFVADLAQKGTTFILISHYMEEIVNMSDQIVVLRDGEAFTSEGRGAVNEGKLANLISGADVELFQRDKDNAPIGKEAVLTCQDVCGKDMDHISFSLKKGEIVGLVGFAGSGAREICRAIFGLNDFHAGTITVNGKPLDRCNPARAIEDGIAYVPNDRHAEGLVSMLSIRENICMAILKNLAKRPGLLDRKREKKIAHTYFQKINVKANSIEDKAGSLSGGNQQKVVVAKIMSSSPSILILDEPTVGIDIKSREEILTIVDEMTHAGVGALYLTNDFGELLRVADRLLVFSGGKLTQDLSSRNLTVEDVIKLRGAKNREVDAV